MWKYWPLASPILALLFNLCLLRHVRRLAMPRPCLPDYVKAQQRAERLFFSLLTPEQKAEFAADAFITVKGGSTNTLYQIQYGYSMNILAVNKRRAYCIHLNREDLPYWDHMVAQLLYIKYNERTFLLNAMSSPTIVFPRRPRH